MDFLKVFVFLILAAVNVEACQYVLIAPKGLRTDTPTDVYIDFHGAATCGRTVNLAVSVTSLPDREHEHSRFQEQYNHEWMPKAVPITIRGENRERDRQQQYVNKALVSISYCFPPACGDRIRAELTMPINDTHGYVFITTDRPAYRPGEEVGIMLASTDQNMLVGENPRNVKLLIKTPIEFGKIVVQDKEKRISRENGFLEDSYTIPEESITGVWWAEAEIDGEVMASTSFLIDRYVTPTFNVKIDLDQHFILPTQESINGRILAKYSYGEPVDGSYFLTFKLIRQDGTEEEFHKVPADFRMTAAISAGVEEFSVGLAEVEAILTGDETLQTLVETGAKVVIMASVTGFTESVFESDVVDNIIFTKSPYIIDYSRSAKYYLRNTIFELRVTIRDVVSTKPLVGVPVEVRWNEDDMLELLSDENGNIYHQIDDFTEAEETITISTNDEDFQDEEQSDISLVVRMYAAERQLEMRLHKQVVDVGEQIFIAFDLGGVVVPDIRYYVISRGQLVKSGTKVLDPNQVGEVSVSIRITSDMVPNARVVAYYVLENSVTANSLWFDVNNVCKKEITITPDKDQVTPSGHVMFTINGPPDGTVYLKAVDRAAYFVHNETRVTRDTLFTKMEEYDTGCSRKGGRDPVNVFEEAGLWISGTNIRKVNYRNMHCVHARRRKRNVVPPVEPGMETDRRVKEKKCENDGKRYNLFGVSCLERADEIDANNHANAEDPSYIQACREAFLSTCEEIEYSGDSVMSGRAVAAGDNAHAKREQPRTDFDENWLHTLRSFDHNGVLRVDSEARDSITIYEVDAFGMSRQWPICVAETKQVKVFTEFFIQLYLPYSVRVHEQATIRFSLFNYGEQNEERVPIYIRHSKQLCSSFLSDDFKKLTELDVEAGSSAAGFFTVLPMEVREGESNKATIEIKAGNDDWIRKELLIEEPGQHNESSRSFLLQPNEDDAAELKTFNFHFDIPEKSVMLDTRKCWIYAYAHPMGPLIEIDEFGGRLNNLQNLIHVPTGCGEQNMIRVGPIVYVHKYRLEAYGDQVTNDQIQQTIGYIQKAYGIEQKWRSDRTQRKAFAVWNSAPPSTWLNAFVTKVFSAAKPIWVGMDVSPICTALQWLLGMQNDGDGSFREEYKVHHAEMRGQVTDTITLTAYVAISLAETKAACPAIATHLQDSADLATTYLEAHFQEAQGTPYALAMGAYALAVTRPHSEAAGQWNRALRRSKEHDGEYIFWRGTRGRAANIETTAYALLAELQLHGINEENDELTRNIAGWLISNRNDKGGFVSTQDSVVALQALSTYMAVLETSATIAPPPTNIDVTFTCESEDCEWNQQPHNLHLQVEDTMRRKTVPVPQSVLGTGNVLVEYRGVGTGSMAYRCAWRQYAEDGECHFDVNVSLEDDPEEDENSKILKISVAKVIGDPAQVSIIDVSLLTGYNADEVTIRDLVNENVVDGPADRYELTENTVKFYLRSVDSRAKKLAFKVKKVCEVENIQPASVSAYDYYEPDIRCTKFYSEGGPYKIRTSCVPGEGNEKLCKCAEGKCPKCRTRAQQLSSTICSNHKEDKKFCTRLCKLDKAACFNLHSETCQKDYLYVIRVEEILDEATTPGFKSFTATITEILRKTATHQNALNAVVEFQMRSDCFAKCEDERFAEIARKQSVKAGRDIDPKHYISPGRFLLVHGRQPSIAERDGLKTHIYNIDDDAGMEVVIGPEKCAEHVNAPQECAPDDKKCRKRLATHDVCEMKSVLKSAHNTGCD